MKKLDFSIIAQERLPFGLSERKSGKGYISYGDDNLFPTQLWNRYTGCSSHQAIIDSIVDYICGQDLLVTSDNILMGNQDDLSEIIFKCVRDYIIYGGFAIQCIYDRGGNLCGYQYIDFLKIRLSEDKRTVYYCNDFNMYRAKHIEIPAYNPKTEDKVSQVYIFDNGLGKGVYPIPSYSGSLTAIDTLIEIQNYHLNSILNNFNGSSIISFVNGVPDDEDKRAIENQINEKFSGSSNGSKVMIEFVEDKDGITNINQLEAQDVHAKYEALNSAVTKDLYIGHRVTSSMLMGLQPESQGFNSNEYDAAFKLFNNTVIKPYQRKLFKGFKKIGINADFKPFNLQLDVQ